MSWCHHGQWPCSGCCRIVPVPTGSWSCTLTLLWLCQMLSSSHPSPILLPSFSHPPPILLPSFSQDICICPLNFPRGSSQKQSWNLSKSMGLWKRWESSKAVWNVHVVLLSELSRKGKGNRGAAWRNWTKWVVLPKKAPKCECKKQEGFSFLWISSHCELTLPEINKVKFGLLVPL